MSMGSSHDSKEPASSTRSSSSWAVHGRRAITRPSARRGWPGRPRRGWAAHRGRGASPRSPSPSKKRSGGPGSVSGPSVGCSTSTMSPWLAVWSHAYTSSSVRTLPAGTPTSARRASSGSASQSAKAASTTSMTRSRCGDPLGVRREPLGGRVEPEGRAQPLPQPLAADGDLHRPVAAVEEAVGADRRVVVAGRPADLAGHGPAGALEGVHADDGRQQRGAHDRAHAGAVALVEGGDARRRRRTSPTSRSAIGTPTRCGSSGPEPVSDMSPASPWAIWS